MNDDGMFIIFGFIIGMFVGFGIGGFARSGEIELVFETCQEQGYYNIDHSRRLICEIEKPQKTIMKSDGMKHE